MIRILVLTIVVLLSLSQAFARVETRWLSVACSVIDDGETQIVIDPMFTRAGWSQWFLVSQLKSDEKLVADVIKDQDLSRVKAIFASHSHYDHVIDAPILAKLTGGKFYTDKSSEIIAKAYKEPKIQTQLITNKQKIQIGKFAITPILRDHSQILHLFDFLPGPVKEDFNFNILDYRLGDTWFYYIEHPDGKILVDQGSQPHLDKVIPFTKEVDALILGIANRKDDATVVEGYPKVLKPKIFIPTHFDNFFFSFDPKGEISYLPGVKMQSVMDKMKQTYPKMNVIWPKYGEKIELLK